MGANYLRRGSHNVQCDLSGFKCKVEETRKMWNGLRVRKDFWEPRHPQDKLRMYEDNQRVPDPRPEGPDVFVYSDNILLDNTGEPILDSKGLRILV